MSKRVCVNEWDYETQVEKVTTTWPNGSQIIVRNSLNKLKTKIHIIDCSSGNPELVGCKKFKLDRIWGSTDAALYALEWYNKFEADME